MQRNNASLFRSMSFGSFSVLVGSLLLLGALESRATTYYVATNGTGNGDSWATATNNIQGAIDRTVANDTVMVSNGIYILTSQIAISAAITVKSLNGANATFINGNYPNITNRCVRISGSGVLDGFTVSNGFNVGLGPDSGSGGGGIYLNGGSVMNCLVCYNVCSNSIDGIGGGGIYAAGTGNIISNCVVLNNTVPDDIATWNYRLYGGGIFGANSGSGGLIVDTRITGNKAGYGGGAYCESAGWTYTNCLVDGNQAKGSMGGLGLYAVMRNCVISNNVATATAIWSGSAGGLVVGNAGKLLDSTVVGNTANYAGGIQMGSAALVSNCQVIANTARAGVMGFAGGIQLDPAYWMSFGTNPLCIDRCVIAGNVSHAVGAGIAYFSSAGEVAYANYPTNNAITKDSLIYGNTNLTGNSGAGGVYLMSFYDATKGPGIIINCTITGNQSVDKGGGLYEQSLTTFNSIGGSVINCIIYGNNTTADDYDEVYNVVPQNTNNYFYSCIRPTAGADTTPAPNQGNITGNPVFAGSATNNYRLDYSSPCINAGTNQPWMQTAVDFDGRRRICYGTVDMGAYEVLYKGTIYTVR